MKILKPAVVFLMLAAITLSAFIITPENNKKNESEIKITASFYPVYIAALNITKDAPNVSVTNLTGGMTGCPHDYQMTPANMKDLEKADVLVMNGLDMEDFLEGYLEDSEIKIIEISDGLNIDNIENGHVWANPEIYVRQTDILAGKLSQLDPHNADTYNKNAARYKKQVLNKASQLKAAASNLSSRDVIIFHDSLEHLCDFMGINAAAVIDIEEDSGISALELSNTVETAKRSGAGFIFSERQYAGNLARSAARDSQLPVFELDSGVTGEPDLNAYLDMLEENTKILKGAGM